MKRQILIGFLLISLFSCAEKVIEKPDNLIPKEKMTDLLYELAILNAAKGTDKSILEEHIESPTAFLFQHYGVDSLQFVQSDIYYASQPLVYEAIYKDIAERLEREKTIAEEALKKRNDTLITRRSTLRDSLPMEKVN